VELRQNVRAPDAGVDIGSDRLDETERKRAQQLFDKTDSAQLVPMPGEAPVTSANCPRQETYTETFGTSVQGQLQTYLHSARDRLSGTFTSLFTRLPTNLIGSRHFDDPLLKLLDVKRLTAVVDIGANPIDGDPPYKTLLQKRGCRVTGFEPQAEALAMLNKRKGELETYLPDVIADGNQATLHICQAPGMTSLYRPARKMLAYFYGFPEWGTVIRELSVTTTRLDDVIAEDALVPEDRYTGRRGRD
jgi:hypothetical protein